MHLLSHTLIAIALSLLDLGSISTSTYALPITDLAPPTSLSTNFARLRPGSSRLGEREIHNADYSSGVQPQNTTHGTAPSTSSNMSGASPAADSSSSVPGKGSKSESAKGKLAMRQLHTKENAVDGARSSRMAKIRHGRHAADIVSREISTIASTDSAPLRPRTLVGKARFMAIVDSFGHSHENNGYHYPYMHRGYAYKAKYDAPRHGHVEDDLIGRDAPYYEESSSDDWNDSLRACRRHPTLYAQGVSNKEYADVSGDGGPRFRDTRSFDPREVAAFRFSHGFPIH